MTDNAFHDAWLVEEREKALAALKHCKKRREQAADAYADALFNCVELGISNVVMARALGVSETAIRLYRKRNAEV